MIKDNWLTLFILSVLGVTGYILLTKPDDEGWGDLSSDWEGI